MRTTFAVIGIHGYGKHHLAELERMSADGLAEVVAVADPRGGAEARHLPAGTPVHTDLDELLAQVVPDVVVIATPIHTHLALATKALRAGSAVLLEKPTTASLAEFTALTEVAAETGRPVQVGFQSFGSLALDRITEYLEAGAIGEVTGIGGLGLWRRARSYYDRSRWAGRRHLDGVDVVDGVVTNPLAHAVATALRIDGSTQADDVAEVEVDLFRVNDIEADDTSAVRLRTRRGTPIALGLTLATETDGWVPPTVQVHGTTGELELSYTDDVLTVRSQAGEHTEQLGRTGLLRNLVDHLDTGAPLLSALADTGAFMRVLEAVRTAPDPQQVAGEHFTAHGAGPEQYRVLHEVDAWCRRVATELDTFTALGAPWTR
ncbi:Gfo/Idh/MocA family protein [Ruania zhangjianzhongii]|uniref:Gfo/Idh/MocA family protein n=1 Tax=Ruania zhangjianzhongii TaxID=2603206 RepID=UPI0011C91085|nr:Gfo/Idh/MocA family oxidoreductase [Ruania zhangjianzhongii]